MFLCIRYPEFVLYCRNEIARHEKYLVGEWAVRDEVSVMVEVCYVL